MIVLHSLDTNSEAVEHHLNKLILKFESPYLYIN